MFVSTALVLSVLGFDQVQASRGSNTTLTQRRAASIRFAPRFLRGANRKLRYTIKAKYPQAIGATDERTQKLNQAIKDLIIEQINAFKKDFEAPEQRMGTLGSYFDTSYTVTLATNDLVSIHFTIDTYFEGAAHPNYNSLVFNYDLKSGRVLNLADLFKPNSNYLKLISDYAIKTLVKKLGPDSDKDWIEKGAGATDENYKAWNLTSRGVKVTFDPYQVASYAEGQHEMVIPYSALKGVIDPAGPLAAVVK